VRRLLDVGCYYGFGVHLGAHLFGWESVGVEPSRAGARGRSELGVDIRTGFLDTVRDLGTFDLVLASEVLEHVAAPIALLTRLRGHLSPGGLVVLTTPAAEVVAPTRREAEVVHAISPGNHRFLASAEGLETLLDRSGFSHFRVARRGATLHAVAATSPDGLGSVVEEAVLDEGLFLGYLDRTADEAPTGSSLANGMASRHFRAAVMMGDFAAADHGAPRMRDAMLARRGFDLDDPGSCADALQQGRRPAWNLPAAAYSMGIHQLVGRNAPELAVPYFVLGARSASAWMATRDTIDLDTWNLRELSLGHLCIALARSRPRSCFDALDALDGVLDARDPNEARRIAWWTARTFNELIAGGNLDVEPGLLATVERSAEQLARSTDGDYRLFAMRRGAVPIGDSPIGIHQ
jgi:SAM-dependent methyltransferase